MFTIYLDKYNRRWIKLTKHLMWNSEAGWGGWFEGIGLRKDTIGQENNLNEFSLEEVKANESIGWFVDRGLVKQRVSISPLKIRVVGKLKATGQESEEK